MNIENGIRQSANQPAHAKIKLTSRHLTVNLHIFLPTSAPSTCWNRTWERLMDLKAVACGHLNASMRQLRRIQPSSESISLPMCVRTITEGPVHFLFIFLVSFAPTPPPPF